MRVRQPSPCVGTRAAADYTGFSLQFLRQAIRSGDLPAAYIASPGRRRGRWLIRRCDLSAFLSRIGFRRPADAEYRRSHT